MHEKVTQQHPHEVAEDTLQTLIPFSDELIRLSQKLGQCEDALDLTSGLAKLMESLSLFFEAVSTIKLVLRIGVNPRIDVMEADLTSILKDLQNALECRQDDYLRALLKTDLPQCLEHWRTDGISILTKIRSN